MGGREKYSVLVLFLLLSMSASAGTVTLTYIDDGSFSSWTWDSCVDQSGTICDQSTSFSNGDYIEWRWYEYSSTGSQVEGYREIWKNFNWDKAYWKNNGVSITAKIEFDWCGWQPDFDGSNAKTQLYVRFYDGSAWHDVLVKEYTESNKVSSCTYSHYTWTLDSSWNWGSGGTKQVRFKTWTHHDAGSGDTEDVYWRVDNVKVTITADESTPPTFDFIDLQGCDNVYGKTCGVKPGKQIYSFVQHTDSQSTPVEQWLAFTYGCTPNNCGCGSGCPVTSCSNEIKSKINVDTAAFTDCMYGDSYLNIAEAVCGKIGSSYDKIGEPGMDGSSWTWESCVNEQGTICDQETSFAYGSANGVSYVEWHWHEYSSGGNVVKGYRCLDYSFTWDKSPAAALLKLDYGTYRPDFDGSQAWTRLYVIVNEPGTPHEYEVKRYYEGTNSGWEWYHHEVNLPIDWFDSSGTYTLKLCTQTQHDAGSLDTERVYWRADNVQLTLTEGQPCYNYDQTAKWRWKVNAGSAERTWDVYVYCYDEVGNGQGYTDTGWDLRVDGTAPTCSIPTVDNQSFSPNADGIKDKVTLTASPSETIAWTVTIQNTSMVVNKYADVGSSISYTWDGSGFPGKVVYRDPDYGTSWVSSSAADAIANDLVSNRGFVKLNAESLREWMSWAISSGYAPNTVVVFSQDVCPDTVCDVMSSSALIRKYLNAGGRVVWIGDWPFYYQAHVGWNTLWGDAGMTQILGFTSTSISSTTVTITSSGSTWGLTQTWGSTRPVSASSVTTNLAYPGTDTTKASAWHKNYYSSAPNSGFVRIWDYSISSVTSAMLTDLYNVAVYSLTPRSLAVSDGVYTMSVTGYDLAGNALAGGSEVTKGAVSETLSKGSIQQGSYSDTFSEDNTLEVIREGLDTVVDYAKAISYSVCQGGNAGGNEASTHNDGDSSIYKNSEGWAGGNCVEFTFYTTLPRGAIKKLEYITDGALNCCEPAGVGIYVYRFSDSSWLDEGGTQSATNEATYASTSNDYQTVLSVCPTSYGSCERAESPQNYIDGTNRMKMKYDDRTDADGQGYSNIWIDYQRVKATAQVNASLDIIYKFSFTEASKNQISEIYFATDAWSSEPISIYAKDHSSGNWKKLGEVASSNGAPRQFLVCGGTECQNFVDSSNYVWIRYLDNDASINDYTQNDLNIDIQYIHVKYGAPSVTVVRDTQKPTTSSSFTSTAWQTSDIQIILTCNDAGDSGCNVIKYCIDSSNSCDPWSGSTYTQPITHSTEGTRYIRYSSDDKAGNRDSNRSQILKLDKTPPSLGDVTLYNCNFYGNYFNSDTISARVTASDSVSGLNTSSCQYSINGGAWTAGTWDGTYCKFEGLNVAGLNSVAITFKMSDVAGNEKTVAKTFTRDNKGPRVVADAIPPAALTTWQNTNATAVVSCDDSVYNPSSGGTDPMSGCNKSTYMLKLYLGYSPSDCASVSCPTDYTQYTSANGTSITQQTCVCAAAKDNLGNVNFSSSPSHIKVDKTAPSLGTPQIYSSNVYGSYYSGSSVDIRASASDSGGSGLNTATCYYSIDGGTTWYSASWDGTYCYKTALSVSGTINVKFKVSDNAGNVGYSSTSTYYQDNTGPTVSVTGAPANWVNTDQTANVSCSDSGSGCSSSTYRLYESSTDIASCPTTYSSYTITPPYTVTTRKWFCAAAKDNLGNVGFSSSDVEFMIDKTPPDKPTVSSPSEGSWKTSNFVATVSDSDSGGSGLSACEYRVYNGTAYTLGWTSRTCSADTPTITVGSSGNCNAQGSNRCRIEFRAKDSAGNIGSEAWRNVSIDWTPPSTSITSPAAGTSFNGSTTPNFTATFSDSDNVALSTCYYKVESYNGSAWILTHDWEVRACNGNANITISPTGDCRHNGANACKVWSKAVDAAGLVTTSNVTYTISGIQYIPSVWIVAIPSSVTTTWQNTNAQAWVNCTAVNGAANCGGNTSSYRIEMSGSPHSCPTTYSSYTYTSPQTITSHQFVCGAAWDAQGYFGVSSCVEFKVDKTAPSTSISSGPAESSWQTSNFAITYSDSDSGGSGLNKCYFRVISNGTQTYPASGWAERTCGGSVTITVGSSGYCNAQGSNRCRIDAYSTDNATNSAPIVSRNVSIDWTPPTASISSPAEGSWQNASFPVSVSFSDSGGSGLNTCQYRVLNGATVTRDWTAVSCTSTSITLSVGSGSDCSSQGSNACTIQVRAQDGAGNIGAISQRNFSIDYEGPSSQINEPAAGSWQGSAGFTLSLMHQDAVGLVSCEYRVLNTSSVTKNWTAQSCSGTSYTWSPSVSVGSNANCNEQGSNACKIEARARDNYYGYGPVASRYFSIDWTAPTASVTSPASGSWQTSSFSASFSFSDTGGSGLKTCEYSVVSGGSQTVGWTPIPCGGNSLSTSQTITVGSTGNCRNEGTNTCLVKVRATDNSSNQGTESNRSFSIDWTPPVGDIKINNDAAYTNSVYVNLTLNHTDATSGVYKIRLANDSLDWMPWENAAAGASEIKSWTLTEGDGTKTVRYQIMDNAGLISATYTDTIILDRGIPYVWVSGAPSNWQNTNATAVVNCSTSGPSGCNASTYRLKIFYEYVQVCPTDYSAYTPGASAVISNHSWVCAAAYSNAGNVNFSTPTEFKVDRIAPSSTITSPSVAKVQSANFSLGVSDSDEGGAGFSGGSALCEYKVVSNGSLTRDWTSRTCNSVSSATITVGPGLDCRHQGQDICTVYVRARDAAGNQGPESSRTYSINWSVPPPIYEISADNPTSHRLEVAFKQQLIPNPTFEPGSRICGDEGCSGTAGEWSVDVGSCANQQDQFCDQDSRWGYSPDGDGKAYFRWHENTLSAHIVRGVAVLEDTFDWDGDNINYKIYSATTSIGYFCYQPYDWDKDSGTWSRTFVKMYEPVDGQWYEILYYNMTTVYTYPHDAWECPTISSTSVDPAYLDKSGTYTVQLGSLTQANMQPPWPVGYDTADIRIKVDDLMLTVEYSPYAKRSYSFYVPSNKYAAVAINITKPQGANLLQNPSFDEGASGTDRWTLHSAMSIDKSVAHYGGRSLKVSGAGNCGSGFCGETLTSSDSLAQVNPGNQYRLSAWVKTSLSSGSVRIHLAWYSDTKAYITENVSSAVSGNSDWTYLEVVGTAPSNAAYAGAHLAFYDNLNGNAWYDDVHLAPVSSTADFNLKAYTDAQFTSEEASSTTTGKNDMVVVKESTGAYHYARVYQVSKTDGGDYTIEMDLMGANVTGVNVSGSFGASEIIDVYEVSMQSGTTYTCTAYVTSGDPDVALYLFGSTGGINSCGTGYPCLIKADVNGAGGSESFQINPPETKVYALVVMKKSGSGNYNVTCTWDSTPPTTSISCNGAACSSGWYTSDVSITLSCSDVGSGCSQTKYCIDTDGTCDCDPWAGTTGTSFTYTSEGTGCVRFASKDVAGNIESTKSQTIKLDKTNPQSNITSPLGGWFPSNFSISAQFSDSGGSHLSSCEYQVESSGSVTRSWTSLGSCSGLDSFSASKTISVGPGMECRDEGSMKCKVYVRATDGAGRSHQLNRTYSIDFTGPSVNLSGTNYEWKTADFNLDVASTDTYNNVSMIKYRVLSGSAWTVTKDWTLLLCDSGTSCAKTLSITVGSGKDCRDQGYDKCAVEVMVNDSLNNWGALSRRNLSIDWTPPTASVTSPASGSWQISSFPASFSFSDTGGSGLKTCEYRVHNGTTCTLEWTSVSCTSPSATISVGPNANCNVEGAGKCRVEVRATDNAGIVGAASSSTYNIDWTPPATSISDPAKSWQNGNFNLSISDSDATSGLNKCYYKAESYNTSSSNWEVSRPWTERSCNSTITIAINPSTPKSGDCWYEGSYACKVYAYATDVAGNSGSQTLSKSINVDWTPPTSTIVSPSVGTWFGTDFQVEVQDSDVTSQVVSCKFKVESYNSTSGQWVVTQDWTARTCNSAFTVTVSSSGMCRYNGENACRVYVNSTDSAGNIASSYTRTFSIDISGASPTVGIVFSPPTVNQTWQKTNATVNVSCYYDKGGCNASTYRLLKISPSQYTGTCPTSYATYDCGAECQNNQTISSHVYVCAAAKNALGVVGVSPSAVEFKIDRIPPTSSIATPPGWRGSNFQLSIMDIDSGDSNFDTGLCEYRVFSNGTQTYPASGWASRPCNQSITVTVGSGMNCRDEGTNKCRVEVRANDSAGNLGQSASVNFSIDLTPPQLISTSYLQSVEVNTQQNISVNASDISPMGAVINLGSGNASMSGGPNVFWYRYAPSTTSRAKNFTVYINDSVNHITISSGSFEIYERYNPAALDVPEVEKIIINASKPEPISPPLEPWENNYAYPYGSISLGLPGKNQTTGKFDSYIARWNATKWQWETCIIGFDLCNCSGYDGSTCFNFSIDVGVGYWAYTKYANIIPANLTGGNLSDPSLSFKVKLYEGFNSIGVRKKVLASQICSDVNQSSTSPSIYAAKVDKWNETAQKYDAFRCGQVSNDFYVYPGKNVWVTVVGGTIDWTWNIA